MNNELVTSEFGKEVIKKMEGFSSKAYTDGPGYLTIGWGHLVKKDENFSKITIEQAQMLFDEDVKDAEFAVKKLVTVPLDQKQFDAMVCFLYNIDPLKFKGSATLRILNSGDYSIIKKRLPLWNKTTRYAKDENGNLVAVLTEEKGLTRRRLHEIGLWEGLLTDPKQIDKPPFIPS